MRREHRWTLAASAVVQVALAVGGGSGSTGPVGGPPVQAPPPATAELPDLAAVAPSDVAGSPLAPAELAAAAERARGAASSVPGAATGPGRAGTPSTGWGAPETWIGAARTLRRAADGLAVVQGGVWTPVLVTASATAAVPVPAPGVPLAADVDGDGRADAVSAVPSGSQTSWQVRLGLGTTVTTFTFGPASGTPVVGDWDGDGRAGVGVFTGREFVLRETPTAGDPQRRLAWGRPGDVALAGDPGGGGRDEPVLYRPDGSWFVPGATDPVARVGGMPGDVPVLGDLDGDGRDDPGVVRDRRLTVLLSSLGALRSLPVPAGRPVVLPTRAVRPGTCPVSTLPTPAQPATAPVRADPPPPQGPLADSVASGLTGAVRYALTTGRGHRFPDPTAPWLDVTGAATVRSGPALVAVEWPVRAAANTALVLGVALSTGGYDEQALGIPRSQALDHARQLLRSLGCTHASSWVAGWPSPNPVGRPYYVDSTWQAASWAAALGTAGWLLWPELDEQERRLVAAVVTTEADRRAARPAQFLRDRDGVVLSPGDTKAEENAWNSQVLVLAGAMFPDDARAAGWRRRGVELMIAATARPQDVRSTEAVDGVRLTDLLRGSNVEADGTVVNHHIVHPGYAAGVVTSLSTNAVVGALGGIVAPQATRRSAPVVSALTRDAYEPDGSITYPQGNDWGMAFTLPFAAADVGAAAVGLGLAPEGVDGRTSAEWALTHSEGSRVLQRTDGRHFTTPAQFVYPGREQHAANLWAGSWLTLWAGGDPTTAALARGGSAPDAGP